MTERLADPPRHLSLSGSAFLRRLAALTELDAAPRDDAFADRLATWFSWTDAIALSSALGAGAPTDAAPPQRAPAAWTAFERQRQRLRALLDQERDRHLSGPRGQRPALRPEDDLHGPYRLRHATLQQQFDAALGPLREQLRAALTAGSPAQARLAALDAVMEQVVGQKERQLLAQLPKALEAHFQRCRDAALADPDLAARWPAPFVNDLLDLLADELAFRLQPLEGLAQALRAPSPPPPLSA